MEKPKFALEVISGLWRLKQRMEEEDGIYAPNNYRYVEQMSSVKQGDVVLTYAASYCIPSKYARRIIGFSIVKDISITQSTIRIKSTPLKLLPEFVPYAELKTLKEVSPDLAKLLRTGMQKYFTPLTLEDVDSIFVNHPISKKFILSELEKTSSQ